MKNDQSTNKCERCRNFQVDIDSKAHLETKCKLGLSEVPITNEGVCEHFVSRFIEYPLTIEGIDNHFNNKGLTSLHKCGKLVRVSPCGEEYEGKTYLGILLGDLPIGAHISFNRESKKLGVYPHTNPGIFVPELEKIIYGCESWWDKIEQPEDLKEITSEEIKNIWYVQLLKSMMEDKEGN
ncbi:hypothetical protein CEB3_c13720 [Peptococcaceae bacterium CEB3]|nr:hypothetical protein CEB3_c13720 [Peptococcaceae bacterium CEB3]